mgnify:CR=1 FL=1
MIKGKKYLKKQVVASVLALSMAAASLTGCSNGLSSSKKESSNVGTMTQEEASTTKVMVIGDYDIYMDELLVYAIQAMVTNNGTLASVKANPDTYKEQTLSLIRTTKILYDVTQHNDVTLDDSDMETTNNTINNFLKSMPDGLLEKYGISEDVVRKVFTEQTYVSKFENDIKNDMGKTIQDDVEEKVKDYNFMVFDYILFPTVETTEDDTPATNTDGSYKYVDDAAKQKAKENAEALLKELEAGGDAETLATKYGVQHRKQVENWVHSYNEFGDQGLQRSGKNKVYSFEFKLHVVELYLSSEVSYQELAFSQGINNPALITRWVNDFRIAGPDALRPKKKGRKKSLKKDKEKRSAAKYISATSAEHIKQLEDENLKLRIENAYLKELRRLRLEEEALLKKQRESSTASEENLN